MMKSQKYVLLLAPLTLAACTISEGEPGNDPADAEEAAGETLPEGPIPVEPDGGIGDGAPPLDDVLAEQESDEAQEPSAFAQTFPVSIRGKWRSTEDGEVTAAKCDGYQAQNMGKVLTIREDSFSYFETGGRFISVSDRAPGHIRAVFDTTYADEQTRDELEFRVDPVAKTLTVRNFDTGERSTVTYRRCPR